MKLKKVTIYNIVFASLMGIYLVCLILNLCGLPEFEFINVFWFQIFLFVIGILILTRGILFRLDSSLFAGVSLILLGVVFLFRDIYVLPFYHILTPLIASFSIGFIVAYIFKNKLYLKLFLYSLVFLFVSSFCYLI